MSGRRGECVREDLAHACTHDEWCTRWVTMRVELTACATLTGPTSSLISMPTGDGSGSLSELFSRSPRPHTRDGMSGRRVSVSESVTVRGPQ